VNQAPTTQGSSEPGDQAPRHRYTAALAGRIEGAWQQHWEQAGTFNVANPVGSLAPADGSEVPADKMFVQDMFPYPSGDGLHFGHPLG
jgi:leucyl-tRNA synthetase